MYMYIYIFQSERINMYLLCDEPNHNLARFLLEKKNETTNEWYQSKLYEKSNP